MKERSATIARLAWLAQGLAVPLVLWLGIADNVEVPKQAAARVFGLVAAAALLLAPRRLASPLAPPLAALALGATASCAASGAAGIAWAGEEGSWSGGAHLVALALAALAAGAWWTPGLIRRFAAASVVGGGLVLAYVAIQAGGLDPMPWNPALKPAYWLIGSLGNPIHLGNFLVAVYWLSCAAWPRHPWPAWLARALLLVPAVVGGERSVLLALGAGAGVAALRRATRGAAVFAVSLGAAAILLMALVGRIGATGSGEMHEEFHLRVLGMSRLIGARPDIWAGACRLLREAPLTGVGPDLFYSRFPAAATYAYFAAEPPGLSGGNVALRLPASPHNEVLGVAAALGIAGLGVYVWALATAFALGRRSPLLPAVVSLWTVHLTNPSATPTALLFWLLLSAMAARPGAAARGTRWPPLVAALGLVLATATGFRLATAQAYRRHLGGLVFYARTAELDPAVGRWSAYAGRVHARQAADDAALVRSRWERSPGERGLAERASALYAVATEANPHNLIYASGLADLEIARGKTARDPEAVRRGAALIRAGLARAPAILSFHDDLAAALEALGDREGAARERALRRSLDPLKLFGP